MNITYGKKWFRAKKTITETVTEAKARKCHENRTQYVAVLSDSDLLLCYIECNMDYIGVGFFDSHLREPLSYTFVETEPGKVFLTTAIYREFDGDSDAVSKAVMYAFKQNGLVIKESTDYATDMVSTSETHADLSSNWDTYPEFGCYDSIIRRERV